MGEWTKKHKASVGVASVAVLAVVAVTTGTFAWQNMTQRGLNENVIDQNYGGRIHDDWNGTSKDIYAENFSESQEEGTKGTTLYVRIRLDEYMETGLDAGKEAETDEEGNVSKRRVKLLVRENEGVEVSYENPDTWITRKPEDTEENNPFVKYWEWIYGGSTIYMPTFNKDSESLDIDVNGTYEGLAGTDKHYDDYVSYTEGEAKTAIAYYSHVEDAEAVDETEESVEESTDANGTKEETHYAKSTATMMTMNEWTEKGCPIGNYWVWDSDGWYYWAMPLYPGETTGLLLDTVRPTVYMGERTYYGVHVVGQFASEGDWGTEGTDGVDATGFYIDGITESGLELLERIASVVTGNDGQLYVSLGSNLYMKVASDNADGESIICTGADEIIGNSDDRADVLDYGESLWVNGIYYGRYFLLPEANSASTAYRGVGDDGKLGTSDDSKLWYQGDDFENADTSEFKTVGADMVMICTSDGQEVTEIDANEELSFKATVTLNGEAIKNQKVTWKVSYNDTSAAGTTISEDGVLKVASSAVKGTVLSITAISDEDANAACTTEQTSENVQVAEIDSYEEDDKEVGKAYELTVGGPDTVKITGSTSVVVGGTVRFTAEVTKNSEAYSKQEVVWSVSGGAEGTSIDENGLLTVSSDEKETAEFIVKATSVNNPECSDTMTVTVLGGVKSDVMKIEAGSEDTVNIDGLEFYVVYKDEERAMLLQKTLTHMMSYGVDATWNTSKVKDYLNGTDEDQYLGVHPTIRALAMETIIYTTESQSSDTLEESQCKVFLLSEADIVGTYNGGNDIGAETRHYTAGALLTAPGGRWSASTIENERDGWVLRSWNSKEGSIKRVSYVTSSGKIGSTQWLSTNVHYIRPAFFISLK